jgi:hypothetical protein
MMTKQNKQAKQQNQRVGQFVRLGWLGMALCLLLVGCGEGCMGLKEINFQGFPCKASEDCWDPERFQCLGKNAQGVGLCCDRDKPDMCCGAGGKKCVGEACDPNDVSACGDPVKAYCEYTTKSCCPINATICCNKAGKCIDLGPPGEIPIPDYVGLPDDPYVYDDPPAP